MQHAYNTYNMKLMEIDVNRTKIAGEPCIEDLLAEDSV